MSASSTLNIINNYSNGLTTGTGGRLVDSFDLNSNYAFQPGTGDALIDLPWSGGGTLTNASANLTLSALAGPGAGTTALAKVRKVIVKNLATAAGNVLTVDFTQTHGWTGGFTGTAIVPAGGVLVLACPLSDAPVVTSGSSDVVRLTAVGTVAYKVSFEGTSV